MESTLSIQRIGSYSMSQINEPNGACKLCKEADWADVIIEGICGKCLLHYYESTQGLWVTDKPEVITEEQKKVFWEL